MKTVSRKTEIQRNKKNLRCLKENILKLNEKYIKYRKNHNNENSTMEQKHQKVAKLENRQKSNIHITGVHEKKKIEQL